MVDRDDDLPITGIPPGIFLLTMLLAGQRSALGWPHWLALLTAAGLSATGGG